MQQIKYACIYNENSRVIASQYFVIFVIAIVVLLLLIIIKIIIFIRRLSVA